MYTILKWRGRLLAFRQSTYAERFIAFKAKGADQIAWT
jgi:hypothetical protein